MCYKKLSSLLRFFLSILEFVGLEDAFVFEWLALIDKVWNGLKILGSSRKVCTEESEGSARRHWQEFRFNGVISGNTLVIFVEWEHLEVAEEAEMATSAWSLTTLFGNAAVAFQPLGCRSVLKQGGDRGLEETAKCCDRYLLQLIICKLFFVWCYALPNSCANAFLKRKQVFLKYGLQSVFLLCQNETILTHFE